MGKFSGYLLASDMDATLLADNHTISDENRDAIAYFTDNGGRFTVATGRMIEAVRAYMPRLGINAPAVLHNGAQLYDYALESVLLERFIEQERKDAIRRVYNDFPDIGLEIYSDNMIYIYRACAETSRFEGRKYKNVIYEMPQAVWERPWIKVLLIGEKELLDTYEPIYREKYDSGYAVRSGERYLDVVANGVSKGKGVEILAQRLGIEKDRIIAVGDNMNDISMLRAAGTSYAVSNGEAAVKEAADFVAPSNNENAVAYIINEIEKSN